MRHAAPGNLCGRNRKGTSARLLCCAFACCATGASAATITVASSADSVTQNGLVTLREALLSINNGADFNADVAAARSGAYGSGDAIHFAIGTGPQSIVVAN